MPRAMRSIFVHPARALAGRLAEHSDTSLPWLRSTTNAQYVLPCMRLNFAVVLRQSVHDWLNVTAKESSSSIFMPEALSFHSRRLLGRE